MDIEVIKQNPLLMKKLKRIKVDYQRELIELQQKTMQKFLAELPEESKQVMNYAMGIDNLKKFPK